MAITFEWDKQKDVEKASRLVTEIERDEGSGVIYTDNPELGELRIIEDFLPPPEELVLRPDGVKVTLKLSTSSVEYFKVKAAQLDVPYQRMIRNLLDEYVRQMIRQEAEHS